MKGCCLTLPQRRVRQCDRRTAFLASSGFLALLQAIGFSVHVQDVGFKGNPVYQGCRQHTVAENFFPFGEVQVGVNNYTAALTPFGNNLKEEFSKRNCVRENTFPVPKELPRIFQSRAVQGSACVRLSTPGNELLLRSRYCIYDARLPWCHQWS